jgi:hypothetical protein
MVKKVLVGLIVLEVLVCGVWLVGAKGVEQGATKSKTEAKISANPSTSGQSVTNERLKSKLQQVGTPTVQQLLKKVEANYHKIRDLKADHTVKIRDANLVDFLNKFGLNIIGDLFILKVKFYFKAPDKIKYTKEGEVCPTIIKNNVEYERRGKGGWGAEITKDSPVEGRKRPWYTLLDPDRFDFYWRLDELMTKFDSRVISHPETDVWVIEAVPKTSNPEDEYNYPLKDEKDRIFVDYNKGAITKIEIYGITLGRLSGYSEIKDFQLIGNVWIPTKFVSQGSTTEEITLSNIQLNTDIPDSEFEF